MNVVGPLQPPISDIDFFSSKILFGFFLFPGVISYLFTDFFSKYLWV